MRIQRYIAKDMRSALAQVREALGPDAVILSSGRVGNEVEVVAAVDMEVARAVENAPPATRVTRQHADYVAQERAHNLHERAENNLTRAAAPTHAEARQAELQKARRASSQLSESLAPAISLEQVAAQPPA